jgi:hypothetical protein
MEIHKRFPESIWGTELPLHFLKRRECLGWQEPVDLDREFKQVLTTIARGEFDNLKHEVVELKKEVEILKRINRIIATEESFLEDWNNEYDKWWNE